MFAHIFKASAKTGFKFNLILSRSASICADQVISSTLYMSKVDAKRAAKEANAIAHNY